MTRLDKFEDLNRWCISLGTDDALYSYACHAYPMEKGQKQKKIIGKLILIEASISRLMWFMTVCPFHLIWRSREA